MFNNKKLKYILYIIIFILILYALYIIKNKLYIKSDKIINNNNFAKNVEQDNELLIKFKNKFPERKILLACEEDITDDDIKDLVVISKYNNNIETIALISKENGNFVTTKPIPAPVENQYIKFFNMDKTGELEILITGEKDGQVGYSIYRILDDELYNIFGEGMENCC